MHYRRPDKDNDKRYVKELRNLMFAPSDVTDEEVLRIYSGTFMAERLRARLAIEDLGAAINETWPVKAIRRLLDTIVKRYS